MKDEIKDIKTFSRNGDKLVPEEKLQIIDLIILKDIHKENLKKIEEEKEKEILKMQKEEERLKKQKEEEEKREKEKLNKLKEDLFKRQKNFRQIKMNHNDQINQELEDM